ncbi:hypothetical protein [uncultured Bilophila sp.]|uniref:hypothetical protein n=1 Tax=uncultured Bilophila sp. TaxID=529385 RepID=UPI0026142227|nr:hypothetical protein [uncultured Bilophila sp.]
MPTMLVLGAGSGIARAAVREFAAAGWDFQLAGRDMGALEAVAAALPAGAPCFLFDAEDEVSRAGLWPSLPTPPDALLCAGCGARGPHPAAGPCREPRVGARLQVSARAGRA